MVNDLLVVCVAAWLLSRTWAWALAGVRPPDALVCVGTAVLWCGRRIAWGVVLLACFARDVLRGDGPEWDSRSRYRLMVGRQDRHFDFVGPCTLARELARWSAWAFGVRTIVVCEVEYGPERAIWADQYDPSGWTGYSVVDPQTGTILDSWNLVKSD